MKAQILAAALLLGTSTFALAADPGLPMEEVPVGFNWTGGYLGVQVGYGWSTDDVADPVAEIAGSFDVDGALAGVHAGYDWQTGNLVVGIVGDFEWSGADGISGPFGGESDVYASADANWQASIRARIGYAMDRTLIYATGGLAIADFDFDYTCCDSPFNDRFSDTLTGYTVGAGAAYAFSDQWNVWAEYRYSDFGSASGSIVNCCADAPNSQDHDVTTNAIRVGLSRRF